MQNGRYGINMQLLENIWKNQIVIKNGNIPTEKKRTGWI